MPKRKHFFFGRCSLRYKAAQAGKKKSILSNKSSAYKDDSAGSLFGQRRANSYLLEDDIWSQGFCTSAPWAGSFIRLISIFLSRRISIGKKVSAKASCCVLHLLYTPFDCFHFHPTHGLIPWHKPRLRHRRVIILIVIKSGSSTVYSIQLFQNDIIT